MPFSWLSRCCSPEWDGDDLHSALSFRATLVNAVFFHILPTIGQSRMSPGIYTAALLYVPFSSWALVGAARDGVPRTAIATAFVAGTVVMTSVVLGAIWLSDAAGYGS